MAMVSKLTTWFPGTSEPFICSAPMAGTATAKLAVAVTDSGGFGFIGGGYDFSEGSPQLTSLSSELSLARTLLKLPEDATLPIGIGFITFGSLEDFLERVIPVIIIHRPAAVWLFAPSSRAQHSALIPALKSAGKSWNLKVLTQIGNVQAAREAVEDGSDVLVVQGSDAGGHGFAKGASIVTLVPEIADMLEQEFANRDVQILAAGGIMDGRGVAAGIALGAQGVVMGTRFIASLESAAPDFIKSVVTTTKDGSISTVKSTEHDDIQSTGFWPGAYDGRAVVGDSYKDLSHGVAMKDVITRHNTAIKANDLSRKVVWAGSGIGLTKEILPASDIVVNSRTRAKEILERLGAKLTTKI